MRSATCNSSICFFIARLMPIHPMLVTCSVTDLSARMFESQVVCLIQDVEITARGGLKQR
jgi:hypothetical protein